MSTFGRMGMQNKSEQRLRPEIHGGIVCPKAGLEMSVPSDSDQSAKAPRIVAAYSKDLLPTLEKELAFLESGGYRDPDLWREHFIFEDSGSCFHPYGLSDAPCTDCPLIQLVPPGRRNVPFPCRQIPLNSEGYTLENMYRYNSQQEIEDTVRTWLKRTIARIKEEAR
jgi:hypothetical protein